MRDLIVFAVVMALLPGSFRRPFNGLLLFSWLAYMRPQDLCWGFARDMRFSFLVGLVMLAGWFVHESPQRRFWKRDVRTMAMLTLAVLTTISVALASHSVGDNYVMSYYVEFQKIIAVALFTTGQVDTRKRLRTVVWTIALCLGFYGVKNGLLGVLAGAPTILRGPGGMLEDNNDFALALVMNLPLLFYLGRAESLRVRRLTEIGIVLTLLTILLTHSRGAFVATVVTLVWIAWRSRQLMRAGVALAFGTVLFFAFAPQHVLERLATISQGGKEASAAARLRAWSVAMDMINDNPVFGVGMRNFQYHFADYSGPVAAGTEPSYVAHNSYLQIWAEGGTPSFIVYLVLLGSVFVACARLRRLADSAVHLRWVRTYSNMMEATTVGFMVGAVFLNRGHFDLIYHWLALLSCLVWIARAEAQRGPVREGAAARTVEVRWRPVAAAAEVGPRLVPRWGR